MKAVITDLLIANCEMSGKKEVECFRIQLDDAVPEVLITPVELVKLLRLRKKMEPVNPNKTLDKKGAVL
jgi:hypothetical protein